MRAVLAEYQRKPTMTEAYQRGHDDASQGKPADPLRPLMFAHMTDEKLSQYWQGFWKGYALRRPRSRRAGHSSVGGSRASMPTTQS